MATQTAEPWVRAAFQGGMCFLSLQTSVQVRLRANEVDSVRPLAGPACPCAESSPVLCNLPFIHVSLSLFMIIICQRFDACHPGRQGDIAEWAAHLTPTHHRLQQTHSRDVGSPCSPSEVCVSALGIACLPRRRPCLGELTVNAGQSLHSS